MAVLKMIFVSVIHSQAGNYNHTGRKLWDVIRTLWTSEPNNEQIHSKIPNIYIFVVGIEDLSIKVTKTI